MNALTKDDFAKLFQLSGRRNRKSYLVASIALVLLYIIVSQLIPNLLLKFSTVDPDIAVDGTIPIIFAATTIVAAFFVGPFYSIVLASLVSLSLIARVFSDWDIDLWETLNNPVFIVRSGVEILLAYAAACIQMQRSRDFGWTGWSILIPLVVGVGWVFTVALYFVPGSVGENRYGPSPKSSDSNVEPG